MVYEQEDTFVGFLPGFGFGVTALCVSFALAPENSTVHSCRHDGWRLPTPWSGGAISITFRMSYGLSGTDRTGRAFRCIVYLLQILKTHEPVTIMLLYLRMLANNACQRSKYNFFLLPSRQPAIVLIVCRQKR
jgi:hypothetical protein